MTLVSAGKLVCLLMFAFSVTAAQAAGDADNGKKLFARCAACHTLTEKNKIGPGLKNIVGRRSGTAKDYKYSTALSTADLIWDEPTLDAFLKDPASVVKKARMTLVIKKDQDRADIIAFLRSSAN